MIRTLVLIAGASFVLAVVCLSGAAALGWHAFHHRHFHPWEMRFHRDGWTMDTPPETNAMAPAGPATTRQLTWSGGDALSIDVPGEVQYTQSPGPATITVSGPADIVNHVVVDGEHLRLEDGGFFGGEVKVVMTAPNVRRFSISGSDTLSINGFDQPELDLDVSGSGNVTAKGKAHETHVDISGDSQVDFGGLAVDAAQASISGAGRATLAPTASADLHISGDGEIDLATHPAQLTTEVSGAGRIVEGQQPPAPPPSPPRIG
jgi:hypothetical protein